MWRSRSWALKAAIHSASSASILGVAVIFSSRANDPGGSLPRPDTVLYHEGLAQPGSGPRAPGVEQPVGDDADEGDGEARDDAAPGIGFRQRDEYFLAEV